MPGATSFPFVRPFLAVAPTMLRDGTTGERLPFDGLYTTQTLRRGAFLGFYNGDYKEVGERGYRGKHDYVFHVSDGYFVPRRVRRGGALRVDPLKYPLAMLNEPPRGGHANVIAVEIASAAGAVPHLPPRTKISAVGFYACDDVPAGQELYVHYGARYHRGHYPNPDNLPHHELVGRACPKLNKPERETVEAMCRSFGLDPARVRVNADCFIIRE